MTALRLLLVGLLLTLCGWAQAATYTFRSDSYAWESSANTVTWDRTCTQYPGDDDKATITFAGDFKFRFAGVDYTSVKVLANGSLQFNSADTGFHRTYVNAALPAVAAGAYSGNGCIAPTTPDNTIFAYWTDLNPSASGSGGVTWEQKGTKPNRYVVISWNGVYQYSTTTPYTFQVILYESASGVNGEFKFQYGNANASGSKATIGVQVNSSDYTQYSYNSGYNANGSAIRWFVASGTPTRLAEYRFDEYGYSGRVGEVKDSTTNSNNGVRVGSNVTTSATAKVCRSLSIPADTTATSQAVDTLVNVASTLGNDGAVTFWYNANAAWNSGPAMLIDATANAAQPFFVMRQSDGSLRVSMTDSAGTVLSATTSALSYAAGTWRHIAVSWKLASSGQSTIRIYVGGSQVGVINGPTNGTLHPGLGTLFVGDNRTSTVATNGTLNSANGLIDEMRVYNYDISAIEITADMNPSHLCPPPLDHYELSLPTTSLTCLPTTVTIKACTDNSSPCTAVESTVNGTAVLSTSSGTVSPTLISFTNGLATAALNLPNGADNTNVTVTLGSESTAAANSRQCCPNGANCYVANSCATTFNRAGLIVSTSAGGAATVPSQVAGTSSGTLYLRSVKQNSTTQACEAGVTGNKTVNWGYQCNNPATCGGTSLMRIDGTNGTAAGTLIKGVNDTLSGNYTGVAMTFDANGNAPFKLNFVDVGRTTLLANVTATNNDVITGTGGPFVTKPAGFTVTNIVNASSAANPAAADDTGNAFTKAGANFSARITAVTSAGATTPNFGKESPAEGVLLTPTLVQPAGGTVGTMTNGTIAGGQFTAGIANVTNLIYSEVGVMTLTGTIADTDYLGAGNNTVTATPSANIGRFYPAGFTATAPVVTNRSALACAPAAVPTFTYLDENFRLGFTLNAVNVQGAVTKNYAGGFAKLGLTASSVFNLAGIDTTTNTRFDSSSIMLGASTGTWPAAGNGAAGTAAVTITAAAKRALAPGGPYPTTSFGIAPTDSDGVAMAAFDIDTDPSSSVNDRTSVGQIPLRQGRLRLQNGMGAANRDIKLALTAEYWNGTAYVTNTLDSCTTVTAANLSYGNFRKQLASGDGAMSPASITLSSGGSASGGPAFITLTKPSGNRTGSLDVAISLAGTAPENSCLKSSWTPTVAATAGANVVGLRGGWCNAVSDPSARAVWGLYRGSNGVVYQRENY